MDPVIQKFRGAVGGFNRRDVLQYIEQMSNNHRKEMVELQKELTRCEGARRHLQETLAGLEDEKGSVAAEEARVRASLEESTATLTRLRGELADTEGQLAASRGELERLQGLVSELAPMAKSYEELKDRVAIVELDAHRKAQATIDEAQAQADEIRAAARQWVEDVLARYEGMRAAVDGLMESARAVTAMEEQLQQANEQAASLKQQSEQ